MKITKGDLIIGKSDYCRDEIAVITGTSPTLDNKHLRIHMRFIKRRLNEEGFGFIPEVTWMEDYLFPYHYDFLFQGEQNG
jgi:hypothetical protein